MENSKFRAGDSVKVRINRRTRFQKLDNKVGFITGEPVLTSSWGFAYEVKLDTGGTVYVDEEDLEHWSKPHQLLHQRERLAFLYHLPSYNHRN